MNLLYCTFDNIYGHIIFFKGEKDGLSANFEQSRGLLVTYQQEKGRLEAQYEAKGEQLKQITTSYEEVHKSFL